MEAAVKAKYRKALSMRRDIAFLCLLIAFCLLAYWRFAAHNLPVAANIDDRTALAVMKRFHDGSANPKFFMYPTLYFYVTYLSVLPFGFSRILLTGHLLNLAFVALTAFLGYLFCKHHFHSRAAGVIAAIGVISSPTLLYSGSYLCTDILLSAFTLLSVDWLLRYVRSGGQAYWRVAMVSIAAAVSTKYTAALLMGIYFLVELQIYLQGRLNKGPATPPSSADLFPKTLLVAVLAGAALLTFLAASFFPTAHLLHFVSLHRTNLEVRAGTDYLQFFHRLRKDLFIVSALLVTASGAVQFSRFAYGFLARKRLAYGILMVLAFFLLTTPYAVLDPGKFAYDIGALLRSNVVVAGSHQQWGAYFRWLVLDENWVLLLAGIAGLAMMAYADWVAYLPALAFVAVYAFTIGSSHLGTQRYLDPILPLMFCASGFAAARWWAGQGGRGRSIRRFVLVALAILAVLQSSRRLGPMLRQAQDTDAYHASYDLAMKIAPKGNIYFAGYAPSTELEIAGFKPVAVSWPDVTGHVLDRVITCSDILIVNERLARTNNAYPERDPNLSRILKDDRGAGQAVFQKRSCQPDAVKTAGAS